MEHQIIPRSSAIDFASCATSGAGN